MQIGFQWLFVRVVLSVPILISSSFISNTNVSNSSSIGTSEPKPIALVDGSLNPGIPGTQSFHQQNVENQLANIHPPHHPHHHHDSQVQEAKPSSHSQVQVQPQLVPLLLFTAVSKDVDRQIELDTPEIAEHLRPLSAEVVGFVRNSVRRINVLVKPDVMYKKEATKLEQTIKTINQEAKSNFQDQVLFCTFLTPDPSTMKDASIVSKVIVHMVLNPPNKTKTRQKRAHVTRRITDHGSPRGTEQLLPRRTQSQSEDSQRDLSTNQIAGNTAVSTNQSAGMGGNSSNPKESTLARVMTNGASPPASPNSRQLSHAHTHTYMGPKVDGEGRRTRNRTISGGDQEVSEGSADDILREQILHMSSAASAAKTPPMQYSAQPRGSVHTGPIAPENKHSHGVSTREAGVNGPLQSHILSYEQIPEQLCTLKGVVSGMSPREQIEHAFNPEPERQSRAELFGSAAANDVPSVLARQQFTSTPPVTHIHTPPHVQPPSHTPIQTLEIGNNSTDVSLQNPVSMPNDLVADAQSTARPRAFSQGDILDFSSTRSMPNTRSLDKSDTPTHPTSIAKHHTTTDEEIPPARPAKRASSSQLRKAETYIAAPNQVSGEVGGKIGTTNAHLAAKLSGLTLQSSAEQISSTSSGLAATLEVVRTNTKPSDEDEPPARPPHDPARRRRTTQIQTNSKDALGLPTQCAPARTSPVLNSHPGMSTSPSHSAPLKQARSYSMSYNNTTSDMSYNNTTSEAAAGWRSKPPVPLRDIELMEEPITDPWPSMGRFGVGAHTSKDSINVHVHGIHPSKDTINVYGHEDEGAHVDSHTDSDLPECDSGYHPEGLWNEAIPAHCSQASAHTHTHTHTHAPVSTQMSGVYRLAAVGGSVHAVYDMPRERSRRLSVVDSNYHDMDGTPVGLQSTMGDHHHAPDGSAVLKPSDVDSKYHDVDGSSGMRQSAVDSNYYDMEGDEVIRPTSESIPNLSSERDRTTTQHSVDSNYYDMEGERHTRASTVHTAYPNTTAHNRRHSQNSDQIQREVLARNLSVLDEARNPTSVFHPRYYTENTGSTGMMPEVPGLPVSSRKPIPNSSSGYHHGNGHHGYGRAVQEESKLAHAHTMGSVMSNSDGFEHNKYFLKLPESLPMPKKLQLLDVYLQNRDEGDWLVAALSYTPELDQAQYILGLKHSTENIYIRVTKKGARYNLDGDSACFSGASAILAHFERNDLLQNVGRPSRLVRPIDCFEADSAGYVLL